MANTPPGRGSRSARSASQVTISAGSVKYAKTTSGGAAIRVVAVTVGAAGTALPRFVGVVRALDRVLQAGERVRPELGEQAPHRVERLVPHGVEAAGAVAALAEQACLLQHRDVLADRLLGERELRRDLASGQLAMLHQPQDLPAVRVGERLQHSVRCRRTRRVLAF